jgi:hypothetical protein
MLTKCQDAAGEGVTRFQIWHGPEGDAIIECYRIAPNQMFGTLQPQHEEKVFVIHRYKFGSPYREDK